MTTNAPRAPIDFDAFERDLQPSFPGAPMVPETAKPDPLAELARIVGQDDPFRALLEARGTVPPPSRAEPILLDTAREPDPVRSPVEPSPAEAFDRYLASVEQNLHETHPQDAGDFVPHDHTPLKSTLAKSRRRARLVQVGAGLGVLVACVSGALALKGMGNGLGSSGPVTVLADKSPLKIAPEKADGVDIPDQNKQIYERNAKDGQIKVVNREEQPLDVAQAARAAATENPPQGGATPGANPGSSGLLTESLGEPRRIRTVAVKPDTPPPAMSRPTAPASEPQSTDTTPESKPAARPETRRASVSPIPTMVLPDSEGTATPAAATSRSPRVQSASTPRREPVATAATTPAAESQASEAEPAPKPASRRALPRRVASVSPEAGMPAAEAEPAAAPAPAPTTTASVGGYAVQLGVRNSAADARSALQQLQAKHSQLAGKPELIRQAELNGKSFYRVRVGPFGKSEAASLCASLKEAGSACFVAAN